MCDIIVSEKRKLVEAISIGTTEERSWGKTFGCICNGNPVFYLDRTRVK